MAVVIVRQKVDIKRLTQHERVVFARARRIGLTVRQYVERFGCKNIDTLLKVDK